MTALRQSLIPIYERYLGLTISALPNEKKMVCFFFHKYSLFMMALRTRFAPNVPKWKARAIIVSRL